MKRYELKEVSDKAVDHLPSQKGGGHLSTVGLYYGKRVGGRKLLELVKAGAHIDADKAEAVYTHERTLRSGEVVKHKYYELKDVIVYNRLNHAKYHRLILQYSRMKLRDTATFGLDPKLAMLTDKDIAKVLEFSRGELLCYYGKNQY